MSEEKRLKVRAAAAKWRRNNKEKVKLSLAQWRAKNREYTKEYAKNYHRPWAIARKYGITPDMFENMWEKQHGLCAICRVSMTRTAGKSDSAHIDHDHITGAVRDLLCQSCNHAVGHVKEKIEIAEQLVNYLSKYKDLSYAGA